MESHSSSIFEGMHSRIIRSSSMNVAHNFAWTVQPMPTYFEKHGIQFPFSSLRHPPALMRDLDIEPFCIEFYPKAGWGLPMGFMCGDR